MARKIVSNDIQSLIEFEDGSDTKLVIESNGVNNNRVKIRRISKNGAATVLSSWDLPLCDIVTCLDVAKYEIGAITPPEPSVVAPIILTPTPPTKPGEGGNGFPNAQDYDDENPGIYNPSTGDYTTEPNLFPPGYIAPTEDDASIPKYDVI